MLLRESGARVYSTDTFPSAGASCRGDSAQSSRASGAEDRCGTKLGAVTEGRGADLVIVAASAARSDPNIAVACSRPAQKFSVAQTSDKERIELSGASVCMGERTIFGCYSASVGLAKRSAELVFTARCRWKTFISHRLPLVKISSGFVMAVASRRASLKIIVQPQRCS